MTTPSTPFEPASAVDAVSSSSIHRPVIAPRAGAGLGAQPIAGRGEQYHHIEGNPLRTGESHVLALQQAYPGIVKSVQWQCDDQLTVTVDTARLPEAVEFLYYQRGGWHAVMAGNDERRLWGGFALYYILSMEADDRCWLVVRAEVDDVTKAFPSVTPYVPAVVWSEREVRDMLGLIPVGLPDSRRLVLPDDWPSDLHPLLKDSMDYRYRPAPVTDHDTYEFIHDDKGHHTTIFPMGPLHVMNDEPGHFRLFVDGEDIIDADYRMFYVHRGMEKAAESRMDYDQVTFFTDRICGICGYAHSVAYVRTIENANHIFIPKRAEIIRTILLETERMHSHLLNLGLACHFTGFDTGFQQFFRVREKTMDLAEMLTGTRKTYGLNLIGGVRRDILGEQKLETLRIIHEVRDEVQRLKAAAVDAPNFLSRTAGIGVLDAQVARDFSPVGPCVRGAGYARDVRAVHPFEGYKYVDVPVRSYDGGDVLSRCLVRFDEFFDSLDIIEQLLNMDAPGAILTDDYSYTPHTFAVGATEAPRGEDVHWSMTGDNQKVYRWRCKAATYSNWPILRYMLRGNTVSDAALIVGSMDPCYSCTDRVTLVDVKSRKTKTVSYDALERYSVTRKRSSLEE